LQNIRLADQTIDRGRLADRQILEEMPTEPVHRPSRSPAHDRVSRRQGRGFPCLASFKDAAMTYRLAAGVGLL
jgi:ribosomal protein L13E